MKKQKPLSEKERKNDAISKIIEIALNANLSVQATEIGNYEDKELTKSNPNEDMHIDWVTISK